MKVGADPGDGLVIFGILHPQDLVVARIVVFRKVDIVLPEEVKSDQAGSWMEDDGKIFEGKKL
jgi:hypothetical protein